MKIARLALAAAAVALAASATIAKEAKPNIPLQKPIGQVTPTGPVPSLAVLNSAGATLAGGTMT